MKFLIKKTWINKPTAAQTKKGETYTKAYITLGRGLGWIAVKYGADPRINDGTCIENVMVELSSFKNSKGIRCFVLELLEYSVKDSEDTNFEDEWDVETPAQTPETSHVSQNSTNSGINTPPEVKIEHTSEKTEQEQELEWFNNLNKGE